MLLDDTQAATLKTYIEANSTWIALPHNSDGAFQIAKELNWDKGPGVEVWNTETSEDDIFEGDGWDWTAFIGLSPGEQGGWSAMFRKGQVNYSKKNIVDGIEEIFAGPQNSTTREYIAGISKRLATDLESLYIIAGANDIDLTVSNLVVVGDISRQEVQQIMEW